MNIRIIHLGKNEARTAEIPSGKSCLVIGRGDASDILLEDRSVSRKHANLFIENGLCWIEDAGSRGGTKLNDRVIAEREKISAGDKITIGVFQLSVVGAEPAKITPEPAAECPPSAREAALPFLEDFRDSQLLYNANTLKLKNRIHTYVLEKLNLPVACDADPDRVMQAAVHDKKAFAGKIRTIFVEEVGTFTERELTPGELEQAYTGYFLRS